MGKTDVSHVKVIFVCFWKLRLASIKAVRLLLVSSKHFRLVVWLVLSSCVRIEILTEMASKGENSSSGPKDVEGYIHGIKTPSSRYRYFDFMVQEHVDSKCALPQTSVKA
jgi:hypothetical protein